LCESKGSKKEENQSQRASEQVVVVNMARSGEKKID
jgi:hypothetical protein